MPKTTKKTVKKSSTKVVENKAQELQKKAAVVGKKANSFAKKNPWAVAGIAAGLGAVVGILSTRGKGKKKKK